MIMQREYQALQLGRYTGQFAEYAAVLHYIVDQLGGTSTASDIKTLAERRHVAFAAHLCWIEPQILDMLAAVAARGVKLGLISNTEGSEVVTWTMSPLAHFFEITFFSHAVGMVKPDPSIYLHACAHMDIEPAMCIFVGDGSSDELWGAAQVGMTPLCAAWFLQRHTGVLGNDVVVWRAAGFPVLQHPSELITRVKGQGRAARYAEHHTDWAKRQR